MLVASPVNAATWRFDPTVNLKETYTDNVFLESDNERDDFITEITPGIRISGKGRYLQLDLDYQYQSLFYADDSSLNDEFHQLRAKLDAELIQDHLFLEADANYGQSTISNQGRTSNNNRNITANRADTSVFRLSPIYRKSFAGLVDTELQYTYSLVTVDAGAGDSESNQFRVRMNNGRKFSRFRWTFDYQKSDSERTDTAVASPDTQFESIRGNLSIPLSRKWSAIVEAGKEDNDFSTSRDRIDGDYTAIGVSYQPNSRFLVELVGGERDRFTLNWSPSPRTDIGFNFNSQNFGANSGDSVSAEINHRTRRSTWEVRYRDETTTSQDILLNDRVSVLLDSQGNPVIDPITNDPILVNLENLNLRDDVINRKRLDAAVSYNTAKSIFRIRLFSEDRTGELTGSVSEKSIGTSFSWNWRFAQRTESIFTANLRNDKTSGTQSDSDSLDVSINIIRRISRSTSANIALQYVDRDSGSNNVVNEYKENSISAGIRAAF